ncbi:cadherin-like domain-containing protein [Bowmanella sp. Y26]|uniref:Ig-like domain-containing protein n=1 Tax=Bowmanella yangjiangensis TaxID=2811230 RepID=UPI001BDC5A45|nr:Ig-like domain-containing protein [Bowmanella yangjiangensis]MBT1062797.1 cadherin-like domain-containing protein [Bowmanella yangjiangensis]
MSYKNNQPVKKASLKLALPALLLAQPLLGHASSRTLSSRSGVRSKTAVVSTSPFSTAKHSEASAHSPFATFSTQSSAKQVAVTDKSTADAAVRQTLAFLKQQQLITGAGKQAVSLSGNTLQGRKLFAGAGFPLLNTANTSFQGNFALQTVTCSAPGEVFLITASTNSLMCHKVSGGVSTSTSTIIGRPQTNNACVVAYKSCLGGSASPDSDGSLTTATGVSEPVSINTNIDTTLEAIDVFDFTLGDGGTSDAMAMTISQLIVQVSGSSSDSERDNITWRLNGPDANNVTGIYNSGSDTLTFSSLSISIADGDSETYAINAYYNNTTGLTEDNTIILSLNAADVTVGGTQMAGSQSDVTNGSGSSIEVTATKLLFTTEPAGSVSGSSLTTQPVVKAVDANDNPDVDFTGNVSLTEASAGSLSGTTTVAAVSGVATFTDLVYAATADQQSFTLTATSGGLNDGTSASVVSDVIATRLQFTTQPAPNSITTGVSSSFSTPPVVQALDGNNILDSGYSTDIVLSVTDPNDGVVDGTVNSLTGTGDSDGSGTTVTLTPSSGSATFTGLAIQYTNNAATDTLALKATSGGLTTANSTNITSGTPPTVTDSNIAISGASGPGGAFRTGDTVTVTWNNTAGGDNNSGISNVTVDFSAFGGGAAVSAVENAGVWTATYVIVGGAIDSSNLNVSVSATGTGGVTTSADTTNATVDNQPPVLTDANIAISGATGTSGAYKAGDTLAVSWDNSGAGDNNSDTISSVTVNFTDFGGGAAVTATNNSDIWTATFLLPNNLSTNNLNVSVTASDDVGNSITTADTSNATADTIVPVLPVLSAPTSAVFINANNYLIEGSHVDDGVTIELEIYDGAVAMDYVPVTTTTVAANSWQFSQPLTPDSEHQYRVRAVDSAGNASAYVVLSLITEDSTAPVDPVVSAFLGSTSNSSYPISGTHTENGVTVKLYADADNNDIADNTTALASAEVTGTNWNLTVPSLSVGANNYVVAASDKAGNTSADVNVPTITRTNPVPPNNPPLISGTATSSIVAGFSYTFVPTASDADGDTLTFSISNKPAWLDFNPITGELSGAPVITDAGLYNNIIIRVSDGQASASLNPFSILVEEPSMPPTISGSPATQIEEGQLYSFTPQVVDNDSPAAELSFSISNQPAWASFNTVTGTLSGTPTEVGTYPAIVIRVSDGQNTSSLPAFNIEVIESDPYEEPVAVDDSFLLTYREDGLYDLNVLANDKQGDAAALVITNAQTDTGSVTISSQAEALLLSTDFGFTGQVNLSYQLQTQEGTSQAVVQVSIDADASQLPIISEPTVKRVDAIGLLTKVPFDAPSATDHEGNPLAVTPDKDNDKFAPGRHILTWRATGSNGLSATAQQLIEVNPIISFGKSQFVREGDPATVTVHLNGPSPVYPLEVPYSVGGTASSIDTLDHSARSGTLTINSGLQGEVSFNTISDSISDDNETVIFSLGNQLNLGVRSSTTVTIKEINIPPVIIFSVMQGGEERSTVYRDDGHVTVKADITDPDGYTESATWLTNVTEGQVSSSATEYVFDPKQVSPFARSGSVSLSYFEKNGGLSPTAKTVNFAIKDSKPQLGNGDSDGDSTPDAQEGLGDDDRDGIANFKDNSANGCNVMPQTLGNQTSLLIESQPGNCLRKGSTGMLEDTGLQIAPPGQPNLPKDNSFIPVGGVFDFSVTPIINQHTYLAIPQQMPIPAGAVYRKFKGGNWHTFVEDNNNEVFSYSGEPGYCPPPGDVLYQPGLTEGHWCVQLKIEDGGPNDDDGSVNGSVVDPGGVAVPNNGNQIPVAVADSTEMAWNSTSLIDVLANDSDADGDSLYILSASADLGEIAVEDNKLAFTPPQNVAGNIALNYAVSDGKGGVAVAEVTVSVLFNRAPQAMDDVASTDDRSAIVIDVLANDTDADDDSLTLVTASAQQGSVSVNSDGKLAYTPKTGFAGTDVITYTISDKLGVQAQGQVKVSVTVVEEVVVTRDSGGSLPLWLLLMAGALGAWRRLTITAK